MDDQDRFARFRELGFERMGAWRLQQGALAYDLAGNDPRGNFLYAFVIRDQVKFLEYSRAPLEVRMDAYRHTDHRYAGTFQPMNKRLRERILTALEDGEIVEIWAFYPAEMDYEGYHLDLAAGLAEGLVQEFKPGWNG